MQEQNTMKPELENVFVCLDSTYTTEEVWKSLVKLSDSTNAEE